MINGSKDSKANHLPIWEKLGHDPNDPNGYDKLLKIFKNVVEAGITYGEAEKVSNRKYVLFRCMG